MKNGSKRSDQETEISVCAMCGAAADDVWETQPTQLVVLRQCWRNGDASQLWVLCDECEEGSRMVRLTMGHIKDKSKGGDDSPQNLRAVCTNCNEGLQNTAPPKPDRLHLLSQVRRATIDDQRAVLDWLLQKYNLASVQKSD